VLRIQKISDDGCVFGWNQDHPEAEVRVFDRITAINGQCTVEGMRQELREAASVRMQMTRYPERFEVRVEKRDGCKLGFRYEKPTGQPELKITAVTKDLLLDEANNKNVTRGLWHIVAMPGMRVEAVNDFEGEDQVLADELKESTGDLVLRIRRAEVVGTR